MLAQALMEHLCIYQAGNMKEWARGKFKLNNRSAEPNALQVKEFQHVLCFALSSCFMYDRAVQ